MRVSTVTEWVWSERGGADVGSERGRERKVLKLYCISPIQEQKTKPNDTTTIQLIQKRVATKLSRRVRRAIAVTGPRHNYKTRFIP